MELLFGIHVREHGYRIGRLSGVEVERGTQQVRSIFLSADGEMGSHAQTRPLAAVPIDHFTGDIVLRAFPISADPTTVEPLLLSRATRLVRGGHPIGRLAGVEVSPDSGTLTGVFGRQHWWTRRLRFDGAGLDFSTRGEVRASTSGTRAA
jgi:hypothetical protein